MKSNRWVSLASGCTLLLAACAGIPSRPGAMGTVPVRLMYPSKTSAGAAFRTTFIDVGNVAKATVSVSGPGIANPIAGSLATINNGASTSNVQIVVPAGGNRIISARALDPLGHAMPAGYEVKGVANVVAGSNPVTEVSWRTTTTARVVEALLTAGSPYAATVDVTQLQALIDQATQPQPYVTNGPQFVSHPSLYDPTVIANAIIANGGAVPAALPPGAFVPPGSISGHVSGLNAGAAAMVQADDPSSEPVTTSANGDFVIANVTPGTGLTVRVRNADAAVASATVNVASGASVTANLSVPADGYLSNVLYNGSGLSNAVVRWTRMPIQVLFVRPSNPASYDPSRMDWNAHSHEDEAKYMFLRWSENLNGTLSFAYSNVLDTDSALASKKAAADIVVEWTLDTFGGRLGDTTPSASICSGCAPKANDLQMAIRLYCVPAHGYLFLETPLPQYSYDQYRAATLHHIGHALGLIGDSTTGGHSPDSSDVMYAREPLPLVSTNLLPTLRDLNTLKQLYAMPADVTRL